MKIKLDTKSLIANTKKYLKLVARHATFIATVVVLLTYMLVVWRISSLASAEPSEESEKTISSSIPKVDKKAVEQILKLEESNSEVRSLFNEARNNPFQE